MMRLESATRGTLVGLLALGAVLLGQGAARADDTVVVAGTSFPAGTTHASYFSCQDLYQPAAVPGVGLTLEEVAQGRRAVALSPSSTGSAAGPVAVVPSIANAEMGFEVRSAEGGSGVAWAWLATGSTPAGQVWAGRADLTAAPGAWQYVDASAATFHWQLLDHATGAVLEDGGASTVTDFTAIHGDGPAYLLGGFGCDGHAFDLDGIRAGAPGALTTYDLEGIPVQTSITQDSTAVQLGQEVRIDGSTVDSAQTPVGTPLRLQQRLPGQDFTDIGDYASGPDGLVSATLSPETSADYRWWRPESDLSDGGWSPVIHVEVTD